MTQNGANYARSAATSLSLLTNFFLVVFMQIPPLVMLFGRNVLNPRFNRKNGQLSSGGEREKVRATVSSEDDVMPAIKSHIFCGTLERWCRVLSALIIPGRCDVLARALGAWVYACVIIHNLLSLPKLEPRTGKLFHESSLLYVLCHPQSLFCFVSATRVLRVILLLDESESDVMEVELKMFLEVKLFIIKIHDIVLQLFE